MVPTIWRNGYMLQPMLYKRVFHIIRKWHHLDRGKKQSDNTTKQFLITYELLKTLFCTGGFECWSQFTGIQALIHKLAKVRILQGSSNSFFIIQLLINYKNKTNKFENLNNSFDNEQSNMQLRYFFLAPPGILKIRLMLSCWLTKYQWNSRYVIDRPCLQKRHLEDK